MPLVPASRGCTRRPQANSGRSVRVTALRGADGAGGGCSSVDVLEAEEQAKGLAAAAYSSKRDALRLRWSKLQHGHQTADSRGAVQAEWYALDDEVRSALCYAGLISVLCS